MSYRPRPAVIGSRRVGSFLHYMAAVGALSAPSPITPDGSLTAVPQYAILQRLARADHQLLSELQQAMGLEFGAFSSAINALCAANLVALDGGPSAEQVVLTATGHEVAQAILELTDRPDAHAAPANPARS